MELLQLAWCGYRMSCLPVHSNVRIGCVFAIWPQTSLHLTTFVDNVSNSPLCAFLMYNTVYTREGWSCEASVAAFGIDLQG